MTPLSDKFFELSRPPAQQLRSSKYEGLFAVRLMPPCHPSDEAMG